MSEPLNLDGQLYFTDLPACIEGGLQPAEGPGTGWITFDYELDTFAGRGLATGACSSAGELVLNLGLSGRHRLFFAHNPALRVWLDGDNGYCEIPGSTHGVREYALPAADLTGRRLHLAPVRGSHRNSQLTVFYIRAEPCQGPERSGRNLVATNDGHGVFCGGIDTPRDLHRHLYPFADSDFARSRLLGFDIEPLLERGLVDSVMIGAGHGDDPALNGELEPLRKLRAHGIPIYAGGSGVKAHGGAWGDSNDLPARARLMADILDFYK